jgi:plasmid stabilization system protein ParE
VRRVLLAPKARAFLLSEAKYLRERSTGAAERFLDRMRQARRLLARFEQLGFERDALPIPGIRRLIIGDYAMDYFPGDTIMIVSIRHGRQMETEIEEDEIADFESPPDAGTEQS